MKAYMLKSSHSNWVSQQLHRVKQGTGYVVEHLLGNTEDVGSIPSISSLKVLQWEMPKKPWKASLPELTMLFNRMVYDSRTQLLLILIK